MKLLVVASLGFLLMHTTLAQLQPQAVLRPFSPLVASAGTEDQEGTDPETPKPCLEDPHCHSACSQHVSIAISCGGSGSGSCESDSKSGSGSCSDESDSNSCSDSDSDSDSCECNEPCEGRGPGAWKNGFHHKTVSCSQP